MIKGELYKKLENGWVSCLLCSHYCKIGPDKVGICKVRKNIKGELYSLNSDRVISMASDPIEKKPLYHFLPSSISYSIAAMGCNFSCDFCQNHSISMINTEHDIYGESISSEIIVKKALLEEAESIAYTYTEPTVYFELMKEVGILAKENNLKNIIVSNGFLSREAASILTQIIDGANIDIKAFSDDFYKNFCGSSLDPVLNTVRLMKKAGIHIEITTLLINGKNDDKEEVKRLIDFILKTDPEIPWHISRFYPTYKFNNYQPTEIESIYEIVELASKMGLKYIYSGNIQSNKYSDTLCPNCKSILIKRSGYSTRIIGLENGNCNSCNAKINGVWQ